MHTHLPREELVRCGALDAKQSVSTTLYLGFLPLGLEALHVRNEIERRLYQSCGFVEQRLFLVAALVSFLTNK